MAHQVIQLSDLLTPNYIVLQGKRPRGRSL